jgi:hypothetical protein
VTRDYIHEREEQIVTAETRAVQPPRAG